MDKLGDLIKIKILISGKTQSFTIDVSRTTKLSELSKLICQKFSFRIEEIKIILNNKPIEKYKDQCLATAVSKDKKPYLIIYFNESERIIDKDIKNISSSDLTNTFNNPNCTNRLNSKDKIHHSKRNSIFDNIQSSVLDKSMRSSSNLINTMKTNLNKSIDSKISIKNKNNNSTSQVFKPVLNKQRNISPRELERKKFIFNKEIENIDSELRKFNQISIDINDCIYFNLEKNNEINNIPNLLIEYEKDFSKIIEKVDKIKDLIYKNFNKKKEQFNNFKVQNQQKLLILKQKVDIFNKNLSKLNKLYSDIFEDFDLETFDELNNIQISSNIYKILESVYERKKEYDEIKTNLSEINSSIFEVNYNPKNLIDNINEKLNTIYLDISSNMNSSKQESIQEISTIRLNNPDLNVLNKIENQKNIAESSNLKKDLIYENLPDFNTLNNNTKRNPNENILSERNLLNDFNTIKSNNKNTLNLNDESNPNIASKLLSSYKKQECLEYDNIQGALNNKLEGGKIYVNRIESNNYNYTPSNKINNESQKNNNDISNLNLIEKLNEPTNDNNQYILKRSLSKDNSANKFKNNNPLSNQNNNQQGSDQNNIIRNIPSQIIYSNENKNYSNKILTNQVTLNNNNIATTNGFYSGYPSNNNDFTEASSQNHNSNSYNNLQESKKVIYQPGNIHNEKNNNPNSVNNSNNQNLSIPECKQKEKISIENISNNKKDTDFNSKSSTKYIVSLKENTNSLFVYNSYSKIKYTCEIVFPLDSRENKFSWNCRLFQKNSDIFVTGGHNDNNIPSKKCLYLNPNIFDYFENNNFPQKHINITELKQMNFSRWAHSLILVEDRFLFCVSGYNNKKCEYLDVQSNKWKNISDLNIWRMDANLFMFNNSFIYVFGGFNDNNKFQKPFVKKIEKLKIFNKGVDIPSSINKWELVNAFDDKGESNVNYMIPCMGIITLSENKFLLVGGDTSDYSNFYEENSNRNPNENMNNNFEEKDFNPNSSNSFNKANSKLEYHDNMLMVKINFLGNCEISQCKQKLNKACCFTTAKSFLNSLDVFYCFDHSLNICEMGSDLLKIQ